MNVNRLKTRREFWLLLIKLSYFLFGLPFLLIIGSIMLLTLPQQSSRVPGDLEGTILIWAAILIPVGLFICRSINRRRFLKSVVSTLRSPDYFAPDQSFEVYNVSDCMYLGIDIRNGTILYVHKIRSGQMDVIGMTMADWTVKEVQGNMFRLYTKHPELPMIQIRTPLAKRWYDTLDAMATKRYSTPQPFPQFVSEHLAALQREHRVYIPTFG